MGWYEERVFPHLLDFATRPLNRDRQALIAQARGKVLELGVGTGANFPFYTDAASEIHGIEPAALLDSARASAAQCAHPERFQLCDAGAEALPYADQQFDTVVACLVFCTIPDAAAAAREVARVLKADGQLLVLEHVAHEKPLWRRGQRWLEPVWTPLACGCHLSRDTASLLRDSGLNIDGLHTWQHPKLPRIAGFMLSGSATPA